jgi:hypothetical protein
MNHSIMFDKIFMSAIWPKWCFDCVRGGIWVRSNGNDNINQGRRSPGLQLSLNFELKATYQNHVRDNLFTLYVCDCISAMGDTLDNSGWGG